MPYKLRGRFVLVTVAASLLVAAVVASSTGEAAPPAGVHPAEEIKIRAGAADRLAGAVRIPTISHADARAFDGAAFFAFHAYLERAFPLVHAKLEREIVGEHSLLFTWRGSDAGRKPILLLGHMDVVPVEPGTEGEWEKAPFSGEVSDGFVWGRGAIDNKSAVLGTLEAVEMLLAAGFRPGRTVYLAYGHDEEVGGGHGARKIAELLAGRGVELDLVLDEGGVIGDGIMPVSAPTALIGVAEKGFASVELSARGSGGHSSLPPKESVIGILGGAVARLEEHPMEARLEGPTQQMFERISAEFPLPQRAIFENLWLTRALVLRKLQGNPTTNAMVRTTTAATIFQAGTKENVLASHARAVVNFRILPGDRVADVVGHVRKVIDDPRVDVKLAASFTAEPSEIARTDTESFRTIERTIESLAPAIVVAPYLVVVVTDARYFTPISDQVFRFLPVRLQPADLKRMHGANERLAVRDYEWAIRFYRQLIVNAAHN